MSRSSCTSFRRFFGVRIKEEAEVLHDLNAVQIRSYDDFISDSGIGRVFRSVFPLKTEDSAVMLDLVGGVSVKRGIFDSSDCISKGTTYSASLRAKLKLSIFGEDDGRGRPLRSQKEQEVYMGDIPIMTERGTFIINGTEKVVVSQMHRSPGVFFTHDGGKGSVSGKLLYSARVIPYRGPWLDLEFGSKGVLYFRIDRKRKIPITTLLRALGYSSEKIISTFHHRLLAKKVSDDSWDVSFVPEVFEGARLSFDLVSSDTGEVVAKKGLRLSLEKLRRFAKNGLKSYRITDEQMTNYFFYSDCIYSEEKLFSAGEMITSEALSILQNLGKDEIEITTVFQGDSSIRDTLFADKIDSYKSAIMEIYKVLRNGEILSSDIAEQFFSTLFFDSSRYDLSEVGRLKLNYRLGCDVDLSVRILREEDIIAVIRCLLRVASGLDDADDIDNLGNRRIRSVGEFFENHMRIGLVRMQKASLERMSIGDMDTVLPHDLVNAKLLVSSIKEFFTSSQLSQFMDQTNPLSAITHKRRLSALGPGGLTRDRAGFEVRDVHTTYYGRICPIETPEGQNIGLINSLAIYARVNKYGFIESPFYKVRDGVVTDEVHYLPAMEDANCNIAQAGALVDSNGKLVDEILYCRRAGNFVMVHRDEVDYIDVSQKQLVSVAASLIPFLENDDTSRALMGSNMQRQAVPLLTPEAPVIGTGMESIVARGADAMVIAKYDGIVDKVDANRIVVRRMNSDTGLCTGVDLYNLSKFRKSNHGTCLNQRPSVSVGDVVKGGDVIADGAATEVGDLALGRNLLVSFISWKGYNFADSIIISQNVVHDDCFTSIHIEEFECVARDTRLGAEEITRDVPGVNEELLYHLDESGVACIGANVKAGEVLVAKITPKGESPMTPEEKLLSTIFGEKSNSFRDASLYVPPGVEGIVVDVQILTRNGLDKNERAQDIYDEKVSGLRNNYKDSQSVLGDSILSAMRYMLSNVEIRKNSTDTYILNENDLQSMSLEEMWVLDIVDDSMQENVNNLRTKFDEMISDIDTRFNLEISKLDESDDLTQGTLRVVKIFIAIKRRLQVGDKMAGRHGNKGVVSIVAPVEDMPFLDDGTPVDVVLNPLGVPSRMNVGQILETHLGLASCGISRKIRGILKKIDAKKSLDSTKEEDNDDSLLYSELRNLFLDVYRGDDLRYEEIQNYSNEDLYEAACFMKKGVYFATPVFEGASDEQIERMLEIGEMPKTGQLMLRDGKTGEYFDRPVTVGYIYILKLHHLVDEKIHARSVGSYSLVTQQPLGGKSHFGGQRCGEMECWAFQAYGAAYTLQEILTIKSDDVVGRVRIYDYIIKGSSTNFVCGIPESFHVLVNELKALCLGVELLKCDNYDKSPVVESSISENTLSNEEENGMINPRDEEGEGGNKDHQQDSESSDDGYV